MKNTHALAIKLRLQQYTLNQQAALLQEQLRDLQQTQQEQQQKISNACIMPAFIVPEQEAARALFISRMYEQQDFLLGEYNAVLVKQEALTQQQLQLNRELKRLEQYTEKKCNAAQQNALYLEAQQADERFLQRRNSR